MGNGERGIFKTGNLQKQESFVNAFIIENDSKTLTFADYCKPSYL